MQSLAYFGGLVVLFSWAFGLPFIAQRKAAASGGWMEKAELAWLGGWLGLALVLVSMIIGGVGLIVLGLLATSACVLIALKQDSLLYIPEGEGMPRSPRDNPKGYREPP